LKKFLHANWALIVGISLPILVIIFFALATVIPAYMVAPPHYNLVFTTNDYYYNNNGLNFSVVDGKLKAQFICDDACATRRVWSNPGLYIFDVHTKQIRKIAVQLPMVAPNAKPFSVEVKIPELENVKIDPSNSAPDGYSFGYSSNDNGLMSDLFFGSRSSQAMITKNVNTIPITFDTGSRYNNIKLIGWITSDRGG
jgi:hypothetical protein